MKGYGQAPGSRNGLREVPHDRMSMHDKGSSDAATGISCWPAKAELGGSIPFITIFAAKIVNFWKSIRPIDNICYLCMLKTEI